MLNDWSDRPPPRPPRPWYARGEFWLAVGAAAAGLAIAAGAADYLLG
jgi:hypothetical protein